MKIKCQKFSFINFFFHNALKVYVRSNVDVHFNHIENKITKCVDLVPNLKKNQMCIFVKGLTHSSQIALQMIRHQYDIRKKPEICLATMTDEDNFAGVPKNKIWPCTNCFHSMNPREGIILHHFPKR